MYKVLNGKYIICTAKQNLEKHLFMTCNEKYTFRLQNIQEALSFVGSDMKFSTEIWELIHFLKDKNKQ